MRLFSIKNGIIVSAVAIFTILGFYWWDGYSKARIEDGNLTFRDYFRSDIFKIKEAVKEVPDIIKESAESRDKARIGSINKLAEALVVYNMEKGQYPEKIEEIIGDYINSGLTKEESFYYEPEPGRNGYIMGIGLDSGEIYEVGN